MAKVMGFNIAISGDATELVKALKSTQSEITKSSKALKDLNKLTKLDGGSLDAYKVKQSELKTAVENTRQKLKDLQSIKSQMDQAFADGKISTSDWAKYQSEVVKTENELNRLQTELTETDAKVAELDGSLSNTSTKGGLFSGLKQSLTDLKSGVSDTVSNIKNSFSENGVWGTIKNGASNAFKSIKNIFKKDGEEAGKDGGESTAESFASGLGGKIKTVLAAAGIATAVKKALDIGADLEQQLGGVETLYKESADKVIANANNAFKTAGMSANNYMETVTSFSASLLNGLNGDTEKAASYADRAITDMADNANKFGTDIESIQNAYQGFAKENYTMLDNLKLGYAGTKEGMQELIAHAATLTDTQEELGVTVDESSMSFDNIVNAISVVQKEMGIAGTTAEEAEKTFSGSFSAMQAAAENFMGALMMNGKDGVDVASTIQPLIDSISTFVFDNAIPALGRILQGAIQSLIILVQGYLSQSDVGTGLSTVFANVATWFGENIFPLFTQLVTLIGQAIPQLITDIFTLLTNLLKTLKDSLLGYLQGNQTQDTSAISDWICEVLSSAWDGLVELLPELFQLIILALPALLKLVWDVIKIAWDTLTSWLGEGFNGIKESIAQWFQDRANDFVTWKDNMKQKIIDAWDGFKQGISEKMRSIFDGITQTLNDIKQGFIDKFEAIKTKVQEKFDAIREKITKPINDAKETVGRVIEDIRNFFNFEWSLPKLKLPHLSITGSFSLVPPSVPKFSIDWYKKAMNQPMLLDGATIFGAMNGNLLGGGEAGREVITSEKDYYNTRNRTNVTNNITIVQKEGEDSNALAKRVARILTKDLSKEDGVFA